jgi:hypothetical protein
MGPLQRPMSCTIHQIGGSMFVGLIEGTVWHKPGPNQPGHGFLATTIIETVTVRHT